jgi:hypothetical protein
MSYSYFIYLQVDSTPVLEPSRPAAETESSELTEEELRSQKLLEELERGATNAPKPGEAPSQARAAPQETVTNNVEPSLPHEVPKPVHTKHIKPTPRIVLPGQITVIPGEKHRLQPPKSEETPIGTVGGETRVQPEGVTAAGESIQPSPTDAQPKESAVPGKYIFSS